MEGERVTVKALLEMGVNVNWHNEKEGNQTPLHAAIYRRDHVIIGDLLMRKANPIAPDQHGFTPLHLSSNLGDLLSLNLLLKSIGGIIQPHRGSSSMRDPHRDPNRSKALSMYHYHPSLIGDGLFQQANREEIRESLSILDHQHRSPLYLAFSAGKLQCALQLLHYIIEYSSSSCGDIDSSSSSSDESSSPWRALHIDVLEGDMEKIDLFLSSASIDMKKRILLVRMEGGMNILHLAAVIGSIDIFQLLLLHLSPLCDIQEMLHQRDLFHKSILHFAVIGGHFLFFDHLLSFHSSPHLNVNDLDLYLKSPLHFAVSLGHLRSFLPSLFIYYYFIFIIIIIIIIINIINIKVYNENNRKE